MNVFVNRFSCVRDSMREIFISTDPFGWPFSKKIKSGRVLYPTDGCLLTEGQFAALSDACKKNNEDHFMVVVVEGVKIDSIGSNDMTLVRVGDYKGYSSLNLTLENAIFSPVGEWGVLISHEMHAVLGGSNLFVENYNHIDRSADKQWNEFKSIWRGGQHETWINSISLHI